MFPCAEKHQRKNKTKDLNKSRKYCLFVIFDPNDYLCQNTMTWKGFLMLLDYVTQKSIIWLILCED